MSQKRAFTAALPLLLLITDTATAQRVVDDAKKFTEKDCRWIYSQFLDECIASPPCTSDPNNRDFSMSTQRGMSSLETVLTVRIAGEINALCERTCKSKSKPVYSTWHAAICKPLLK
jgi:hypothetical protein